MYILRNQNHNMVVKLETLPELATYISRLEDVLDGSDCFYAIDVEGKIICRLNHKRLPNCLHQLFDYGMKQLGYKSAKIASSTLAKIIAEGTDMGDSLRGHLAYWEARL